MLSLVVLLVVLKYVLAIIMILTIVLVVPRVVKEKAFSLTTQMREIFMRIKRDT